MKPLKTIEFTLRLMSAGAFFKFRQNLKKYRDYRYYTDYCKDIDDDWNGFIKSAFMFDKSPEGLEYWARISSSNPQIISKRFTVILILILGLSLLFFWQ